MAEDKLRWNRTGLAGLFMTYADDILLCSETLKQVNRNAIKRRGRKVMQKVEYMRVCEGSGWKSYVGGIGKVEDFKYLWPTLHNSGVKRDASKLEQLETVKVYNTDATDKTAQLCTVVELKVAQMKGSVQE